MVSIGGKVGAGQPNLRADVRLVQILLNLAHPATSADARLDEDGLFGPRTGAAIAAYQRDVLNQSEPDGIVEPGGPLIASLAERFGANVPAPALAHLPSQATGRSPKRAPRKTVSPYKAAAARLGCAPAAIEAVAATETMCEAFDDLGRPTILFERHKFHAFTGGRFDAAHPDLSNPVAGGYGKFSEQYQKLARASALDAKAAPMACSWGQFQIMGFNHARAGFADVESFVAAMHRSPVQHLEAFVRFVQSDPALVTALRHLDWPAFAAGYNGPGYARNRYDLRMREHYEIFAARS